MDRKAGNLIAKFFEEILRRQLIDSIVRDLDKAFDNATSGEFFQAPAIK
jgi:hypothetical protein